MHYTILLFFGTTFGAGAYLILAEFFKVPTFKTTKAILNAGKKDKKHSHSLDAVVLELAIRLSKFLHLDDYRRRKLAAMLKSAEIPLTPEVYTARALVKAGLTLLWIPLSLLIFPILAPVLLILGIAVYFKEMQEADEIVKVRRDEIEYELPRFVATIIQELMASRDVLNILETYQKNAGGYMKNELAITTADMRTGNYEAALTRFEARLGSAMLSDVVRGLIGVLRGDNGVVYFQMLGHDMKQLELQRLKKLALMRPPKIRKYSFMLLGCMLMVYLGVMGYEIIKTMSRMF